MAFFYGWTSTASRLEPLPGGSSLFTTKFPEISGTHFINFRKISFMNINMTQFKTFKTFCVFAIGTPQLLVLQFWE